MYDNHELLHFGVLGMKWGIRKDSSGSGKSGKRNVSNNKQGRAKTSISKEGTGDQFKLHVKNSKNETLGSASVYLTNTRFKLASSIGSNKPVEESSKKAVLGYMPIKSNVKAIDAISKHMEKIAKQNKVNKLRFMLRKTEEEGVSKEVSEKLKSNGYSYTTNFGYAIEYGKEVKHSEISDSSNELAHYGVLGMKWGIRKDEGGSSRTRTGKSGKVRKLASAYDDEKLKKINARLQLEETYYKLTYSQTPIGRAERFAKQFVAAGGALTGAVVFVNKTPLGPAIKKAYNKARGKVGSTIANGSGEEFSKIAKQILRKKI